MLTLVASSLYDVIDTTPTRFVAVQTHPPLIIFVMLGLFALADSFPAGYEMGSHNTRSLVHMFCFVFLVSGVVYVILDLEFPRFGLIRTDAADEVLAGVRQGMK